MAKQPDEQVDELIARAVRAVESVPDDLRPAAFTAAFDFLVTDGGGAASARASRKRGNSRSRGQQTRESRPAANDDPADTIISELDRTAHPEVMVAERTLERALLVLKIAQEEFDIDGLSPPQIAKVLNEKFRIKTSRQAVGQALDGVGALVDRVPGARGSYRYRLMAAGMDHLASQESGTNSTDE